jgi:hypothetical protein
MKQHVTIFLSAVALVGAQVHAANLVQNPGFENGGSSYDWTITLASVGTDFQAQRTVLTGNYAAGFGAVGIGSDFTTLDEIDQEIPTTAGDDYDISFWLKTTGGDAGLDRGRFVADFGSANLLDQDPPSPLLDYTEYSYVVEASGPSTDLAFYGKSVSGWYELDDVSVTDAGRAPTSGVPDTGSSFALMTAALGALGAVSRKLRR